MPSSDSQSLGEGGTMLGSFLMLYFAESVTVTSENVPKQFLSR